MGCFFLSGEDCCSCCVVVCCGCCCSSSNCFNCSICCCKCCCSCCCCVCSSVGDSIFLRLGGETYLLSKQLQQHLQYSHYSPTLHSLHNYTQQLTTHSTQQHSITMCVCGYFVRFRLLWLFFRRRLRCRVGLRYRAVGFQFNGGMGLGEV